MTLGPFAFEGIGFGFDSISQKLNTSWSEIEVAQRMNAQQFTGPGSSDVTIKGVLFPAEYGGQASLEGIKRAAEAGEPLMLVTGWQGEGIIRGLHTIQSVDDDRSHINARGTPRKSSYSISLKRYDGQAPGLSSLNSFLSLFG